MRILIFIGGLVLASQNALACNCIAPNMASSASVFESATYVIEAEILSSGATTWIKDRELGEQVATVRPLKFYKGKPNDTVMFSYSENTAACGIGTLQEGAHGMFVLYERDGVLVSGSACDIITPEFLDRLD